MKFNCESCNKNYTSYASLWVHKKNIHKKRKRKITNLTTKNNICEHCNKTYANKSSLNKHIKICKTKQPNDNALDIIKEIVPIFKTLAENMLQSNNNNNNNINNSHNITNNQHNNQQNNINNNITVSLGNENIIDVLTIQEQLNILKQKNEALEGIITMVHFNKKYPQFQNIAIDDDNGYIYDETQKTFVKVSKDDLMNDIIENRINDIYDLNTANKLRLPKKIHDYINSYTSMFALPLVINKNKEKIEDIICHGTQTLSIDNKLKITD
jgi:hypothetical protein